ncbi:MAG: hypothetical protein KJI71_04735 [Patescibacteria group bacterium]|nr:hypothetical protein [Patescibacteria group bacterium]
MAIIFQEQVKRQRNLIYVFIALALLSAFIIFFAFYVRKEPSEELISRRFKKVKIDFEVLKSPLLEQLQLTEKTPLFEGEIGRDNPFVP